MSATRQCRWCGATVPAKTFCPTCLAAFPERPAPETMTPGEREAEFRSLEWTEVPFDLIHGRLEQLLGRPAWTHEFGLNWEGLCKEARWEGRPATFQEIVDLIPAEKRLIVTVPDTTEAEE